LSAKLTKNALLQTVFLGFCPSRLQSWSQWIIKKPVVLDGEQYIKRLFRSTLSLVIV